MTELLIFLAGLLIGGIGGMLALAMAVVAADNDHRTHELDAENQS